MSSTGTTAAPRGVHLPGADGIYVSTMTGLSLAAGVGVIACNIQQGRARAAAAAAPARGRTVLSRPVVVVTNTLAAILLANALICALGAFCDL
jgi:hypothetical protein